MSSGLPWSVSFKGAAWRGRWVESQRELPEEAAVALTYNRVTHAVMMATAADLHDFAVGFSLSEGVIGSPPDIEDLAIVPVEGGMELRMWIPVALMTALETRRRRLAGATGCGMCGLESLAEALRPVPRVGAGRVFSPRRNHGGCRQPGARASAGSRDQGGARGRILAA